jgi:hypothetical protein
VAIAAVAARVPDYLAGGVHPSRAVLRVAERWYTVGPALVLCLAGATSPDWGDWTSHLGALGAPSSRSISSRPSPTSEWD